MSPSDADAAAMELEEVEGAHGHMNYLNVWIKMTTKINYALDHHKFMCQKMN